MAFQGKWRLVFKRSAADQDVLADGPSLSEFSSTGTMPQFEEFAKALARKIAGVEILFHYVGAPDVRLDGSYVAQSTGAGTVILNVGSLGEGWFDKSNWRDQVEALIFLLSQHRVQVTGCDSPQDADMCFREELAHLGAASMSMAMEMVDAPGSAQSQLIVRFSSGSNNKSTVSRT